MSTFMTNAICSICYFGANSHTRFCPQEKGEIRFLKKERRWQAKEKGGDRREEEWGRNESGR